MLKLETAQTMSPVHSVRLIEASPEVLRDMADRMDNAAKSPTTDGVILCPFTSGVVLAYKPEKKMIAEVRSGN